MSSKPATFVRAVVLLAVVGVGVPWVLMAAADRRFGGPAPWSAMPPVGDWSATTVRDALTDRLSETTIADVVIRVGLAVVWLAVIVLLATVVVEFVHMVRHAGIAMPTVRGLGPTQDLARLIAAGLLVVVPLLSSPSRVVADDHPLLVPEGRAPATGTATPDNAWIGAAATGETPGAVPVDPAVGGSADGPVAAAPTDDVAPARPSTTAAGTGTYTVRPGDSVYGIAERFAGPDLGAISAYADGILDLNLGQRMIDGQLFTNAAYVDVGWVLQLPPSDAATSSDAQADAPFAAPGEPAGAATPAASAHVVEEGESLWSIADDELGDATRWPEIYRANEGRTFDDGRHLSDPDVIQPGWELDLPTGGAGSAPSAPPTSSAPPPPTPPSPTPSSSATSTDTDDPTTDTTADGPDAPAGAADVASRRDNAWVDTSSSTVTPTEQDDGAAATDELEATDDSAGVASEDDLPSGSTIAEPEVDVPAVTSPAVAMPPSRDSVDPDTMATEVDADGAVQLLTFERAAMLSAGVLTLLAVRRRSRMRRARPNTRLPDPRPAVVTTERALRTIDAGDRFARVDVAIRAAALRLIEDAARVEAVAVGAEGDLELWTSAACTLDAPWEPGADDRRWLLPASTPIELLAPDARRVGSPCPTLVQLGTCDDGRDLYVDLEALEAIEVGGPGAAADAIVAAVAATLATSVLAEVTTLVGVGVDDAAFLGHRHHQPARSVQDGFATAFAAIGATARVERSTFDLRARVTSGETWEPAVVLVGSAGGTVTPPGTRAGLAVVSAAPIHGPSSRLAPEDGTWVLRPLGVRLTPIGLEPGDVAALAAVVDVPEARRVDVDLDEGVDGDVDVDVGAGADLDRTMPPSEFVDAPATHAALGDAVPDDAPPPELPAYELVVRLLGPVSVESADGRTIEFERSKTKELIAWLATHRDRSTRSNARAALWELDVRDNTFSNVVSEARRSMARCVEPPDGEEWLGRTLTDALPLHELVVTDADLVDQALAAARLQPPALAIEMLRPALDWIAGVPFEGTSYLWPDAEGITSGLVLRAITLTTFLADHCLSVGDVDGVFEATSRGLQVLPAHEDMIAVRMRAYAKIGDRAGVRHEWESYERAITTDPWSDGEPSPKMIDLRRELL